METLRREPICGEEARKVVAAGTDYSVTGTRRKVYAALLREGGWPETAAALEAIMPATPKREGR